MPRLSATVGHIFGFANCPSVYSCHSLQLLPGWDTSQLGILLGARVCGENVFFFASDGGLDSCEVSRSL